MKIEIIGAGIIGFAFGKALIQCGHSVKFIDQCQKRIDDLQSAGFEAGLSDHHLSQASIHFLCVPTPTIRGRQDLTSISNALADLAQRLQPGVKATVAIRSTILPGTSKNWAVPLLEQGGRLSRGKDFNYVFFPEFLRQRHAESDAATPRIQVLGELEPGHGDELIALLKPFNAPIIRMSSEAAELQKYAHNLFNATKISYFNDLRLIAHRLDLGQEIESIFSATCISAEAIWNPPYGTKDLGSFKGACLPKDLTAFLQWTEAMDADSPLLKGVLASNQAYDQNSSI